MKNWISLSPSLLLLPINHILWMCSHYSLISKHKGTLKKERDERECNKFNRFTGPVKTTLNMDSGYLVPWIPGPIDTMDFLHWKSASVRNQKPFPLGQYHHRTPNGWKFLPHFLSPILRACQGQRNQEPSLVWCKWSALKNDNKFKSFSVRIK